jgi:hypothetical protein
MYKAHVQHAIGLIEHKNLDIIQRNKTLVHQIQETSRCGYQDIDALFEGIHLGFWFTPPKMTVETRPVWRP